jgi:hypothetical protein
MSKRDGNSELWEPMQKISRTVERVYYPLITIVSVFATFLSQYAMIGIGFSYMVNNDGFSLLIDFANEVVSAFAVHVQTFDPVNISDYQISGGMSGTYADV